MDVPVTKAPTAGKTTLHVLGDFSVPYGGAAFEVFEIQRLLQGLRPVKVWSEGAVNAIYATPALLPIRPFARQFPVDGTLLILGTHVRPGLWLQYTRMERIVLFCNLTNHAQIFSMLDYLRSTTRLEPELVFASQSLQLSVGLPGRVLPSVIELEAYLKVAAARFTRWPAEGQQHRPLTVGRMSRDTLEKHHPDDPLLYRLLASRGLRVRIMGGTCLAPALAGVDGIELLPSGYESSAVFLDSLDIFFYRTGAFNEPYGRVVLEAMASGLAVVGHVRGGYAEVIEPGISGQVIRTQEEAYDAIMAFNASPSLRLQAGQSAMKRAMEVHGPEAMQRDISSYLG